MNFLFVFRGQHKNWNSKTAEEWEALNKKHDAWLSKFKPDCKSGVKLASKPSKVLRETGGALSVTDGPFTETKEVLTGYYLVEAEDMEKAVEHATGCPWLFHDEMEIFEAEG